MHVLIERLDFELLVGRKLDTGSDHCLGNIFLTFYQFIYCVEPVVVIVIIIVNLFQQFNCLFNVIWLKWPFIIIAFLSGFGSDSWSIHDIYDLTCWALEFYTYNLNQLQ